MARGRPRKNINKVLLTEIGNTEPLTKSRGVEIDHTSKETIRDADGANNLQQKGFITPRSSEVEVTQTTTNTVVPSPYQVSNTRVEGMMNMATPSTAPKTTTTTNPDKQAQLWVEIFNENRLAIRGMNLSYVSPTIIEGEKVVQLQQEEVEKESEKWRHAIILYVVRDTPSIEAIERFIAKQWNFATNPDVFFHSDGYFVVRFNSLYGYFVVP